MNITFVATRDAHYMRRLMRDTARGTTWFATFYLVASVLAIALCVVTRDRRAILAAVLDLALLVVVWRSVITPSRRALAQWPAYFLKPHTYAISDEGITISSATASSWFSWAAVTRVEERPYAFLLFINRWSYRDVPRANLTGQQDGALRALLVNRELLEPAEAVPADR